MAFNKAAIKFQLELAKKSDLFTGMRNPSASAIKEEFLRCANILMYLGPFDSAWKRFTDQYHYIRIAGLALTDDDSDSMSEIVITGFAIDDFIREYIELTCKEYHVPYLVYSPHCIPEDSKFCHFAFCTKELWKDDIKFNEFMEFLDVIGIKNIRLFGKHASPFTTITG